MKILTYVLFLIGAVLAIIGTVIMTDAGQMIGIEKSIVVWFFENSRTIILLSALTFFSAIYLARKNQLQSKRWSVIFSLVWVVCILVTKLMTPYILFRDQQDSAEYISIEEVNDYLDDEDRVLVVNYNGVQKAFPPKAIWQAHIFGGDYNGEEVVFTYCIMTNLGSPIKNEIGGKRGNFKVLAQTNNNLLLWDTESDEIIQQITQECEFSKEKLDPIPVYEMTYRGYKKLFPEGEVLYNVWDKPMEKAVDMIFDVEDAWYGEDFMFKTSNFEDERFPFKEHVVGIRDDANDAQLAVSKDYLKGQGIVDLKVGEKDLVIAYFPEYETIAAFDKGIYADSTITELSALGMSNQGQLEQEYLYNSVYWSVWAYYYPNTDVLK